MRRTGTFVILYCDNCGYEEEVHYKEIERRSLRCPHCQHFIDYEAVDEYEEFDSDDEEYYELDY